jgi:CheY-like chemotaxis protein
MKIGNKMIAQQMNQPIEILLGEDNPGDVYIIENTLSKSQAYYSLNNVTDGEAVIAYLRRENNYQQAARPDLLVLDLNLPKKHGFEVLEEIKNDPELKDLPVVILTSSNAETDILKSYQLYASCYITKPSDINEFFDAVVKMESFWLNLVKLPPKKIT